MISRGEVYIAKSKSERVNTTWYSSCITALNYLMLNWSWSGIGMFCIKVIGCKFSNFVSRFSKRNTYKQEDSLLEDNM